MTKLAECGTIKIMRERIRAQEKITGETAGAIIARLTDSLLKKDVFTANFLLTIYFLFVIIRHNERGTWKE